jgi:hypothetical protein
MPAAPSWWFIFISLCILLCFEYIFLDSDGPDTNNTFHDDEGDDPENPRIDLFDPKNPPIDLFA